MNATRPWQRRQYHAGKVDGTVTFTVDGVRKFSLVVATVPEASSVPL